MPIDATLTGGGYDVSPLVPPIGPGTGDALVANPLSQFAATSSNQLRGVMTDETGTGALVFGTSPTITTPTLSGIVSTDGASTSTAAAMAALVVDVTKDPNSKSLSANQTLTFSATPPAGRWFSVMVKNTGGADITLTSPSSFSLAQQVAITSLTVPASGRRYLLWYYDGTDYSLWGDA